MENMTLKQLTDRYNELIAELEVKTGEIKKPIKLFSCSKAEAIRRVEVIESLLSQVTEPEVTEPEVTEPEVTEPEVTEPEVTEPERTDLQISTKLALTNPNLITFPKLIVLTDIKVNGINEDGNEENIELDPSLRLAGHMIEGNFRAVRNIKTDRYRETAHDFTFNTITNHLNERGLKFGVWNTRFNIPHDHMVMDLILDQQYKINEDLFESELNIAYNSADNERRGIYQPMIRLTNSFFSASKLEFALIRIICANGLYRVADKLTIKFNHLDRNILNVFEEKTNIFLSSIFEKHFIEDFISSMTNLPLKSAETLLDWLYKYAGKQNAERAVAKFQLTSLDVQKKLNMWIVYNIVTWLATHKIQNLRREQHMFAKLKELRG